MQFCFECHNMYYMRLGSDSDTNGTNGTNGNSGSNGDKLEFYCRNCGHQDTTLTNENIICVSEYQTQSSDMKLKNMINKYTKYDPTLPRVNNILCPNPQCPNHTSSGKSHQSSITLSSPPTTTTNTTTTQTLKGQNKDSTTIGGAIAPIAPIAPISSIASIGANDTLPINEESTFVKSRDSDIIYIRYDDENMKYAWICSKCDYTWTNDNHIDNKN